MVKLLLTALLTAKLLTPPIPFTFLPDFAILALVIAKMLLTIVLLLLPTVFCCCYRSSVAVNSRSAAVNSGFIAVQKYNIMHS